MLYVMSVFMQGLFCVCAQPMRGDVTLQSRLSLAGRMHNIIPVHMQVTRVVCSLLTGPWV